MNILIGVTGSIACYKTLDLCRLFIKQEHRVRVVLTRGAEKFLKKEIFSYLGVEQVYSHGDDFALSKESIVHIELARWADTCLLCPVSANSLAKVSYGMADDLLTSLLLVLEKTPVLIFPAMNPSMLKNQVTQENLKRLAKRENYFVFDSAQGETLCGEEGEGRLLDIENIFHLTESISLNKAQKKVLITTGASISPIDPIRYLTNSSSGITGFEMAKEFLRQGHHVTLILGVQSKKIFQSLSQHPNLTLYEAVTTQNFLELACGLFPQCDIYISTAALNDIEFRPTPEKLKKDEFSQSLSIQKAPDVLAEMLKIKQHQFIIGFAAETKFEPSLFQEKLKKKPVDLLIGNQVGHGFLQSTQKGFGKDSGRYLILKNNQTVLEAELDKTSLAKEVFHQCQN